MSTNAGDSKESILPSEQAKRRGKDQRFKQVPSLKQVIRGPQGGADSDRELLSPRSPRSLKPITKAQALKLRSAFSKMDTKSTGNVTKDQLHSLLDSLKSQVVLTAQEVSDLKLRAIS